MLGPGGSDVIYVDWDFVPAEGHACAPEEVLAGLCPHREFVVVTVNGGTSRIGYDHGSTVAVFAGAGNDRVDVTFGVGKHWRMGLHGGAGNDLLLGLDPDDRVIRRARR